MRTPFVSKSRAAALAEAKAKREWLLLLNAAVTAGQAAAAGEIPGKEAQVAFAGQVVRIDRHRFPLPFASAGSAAAGFRELARGYVAAAQPELKGLLGAAMAAAADCCRQLIAHEDQKAVAAWRRQTGED